MKLFLLALSLFSTTALATPPSYWQRISSSKSEGLIALQEAQLAYRGKDWPEAIQKAAIAREIAPSVEADYIYGLSMMNLSVEQQSAKEDCSGVLNLLLSVRERSEALGSDLEVIGAIGLCAAVVGEFEIAITENTLLAYDPSADPESRGTGFANLGDSLMATQDLKGAADAYIKAYNLLPGQPYMSFALAVALYRSNETRSASVAIQRALAIDPDYESLESIGTIYVPEEDKSFFLAVAAAGSDDPGLAHSYLGEYLSEAPDGLYRSIAMRAFLDVDAFTKDLTRALP